MFAFVISTNGFDILLAFVKKFVNRGPLGVYIVHVHVAMCLYFAYTKGTSFIARFCMITSSNSTYNERELQYLAS